ncbi:hypothetical protein BV25DRAFT_1922788, partial [Artomyces pyxidatus]
MFPEAEHSFVNRGPFLTVMEQTRQAQRLQASKIPSVKFVAKNRRQAVQVTHEEQMPKHHAPCPVLMYELLSENLWGNDLPTDAIPREQQYAGQHPEPAWQQTHAEQAEWQNEQDLRNSLAEQQAEQRAEQERSRAPSQDRDQQSQADHQTEQEQQRLFELHQQVEQEKWAEYQQAEDLRRQA